MAGISVSAVLQKFLPKFDEELLDYITAIVDEMSLDEKRSHSSLHDVMGPFIVDTGYADESGSEKLCKDISIAFGGSGYKNNPIAVADDTPLLLSAPVRISDNAPDLKNQKKTYGGAVIAGADDGSDPMPSGALASNSLMDVSAIPTTQKQLRKLRKENEVVQKILKAESLARATAAADMAAARMAAIKASRSAGRQANTGVNIERLSLPHPSGTGDLLTDATLILAPGRRYGLVGRNGAGKSTLLRCLANYKVDGLMHLRILLVEQHVEGDEDTALQWLLRADVERTSLMEDEARLSAYLHGSTNDPLPADLKGVNLEVALSECFERMDAIGVHTAENRASKILYGLGFDEHMLTKPTCDLSGGWAMRAALGAALFVKPNLLLLDEPTNHLDLHALVWLENWLSLNFDGMAIVVSHDQYFLNSVCTDVLELRSTLAGQLKTSLEHYSGDYQTYQNTLAEKKIVQARAKIAYDKEKEKLKEFISREGRKYDNPAHQSQRKMKLKQLEALVEVESVEEDGELVMIFPTPFGVFDSNEKLVSITKASFAWPGEASLFSDVEFNVSSKARFALLGKNGCGKTSLLNLLIGDSVPTTGSATRHSGCRVTMLQQHHYRGEQLDPNLCALDHIKRLPQDESSAVGLHDPGTRQEETSQRSYLSNFGIRGGRAMIPVRYLSGGQRMRVALSVALFRRPDLLILDEPTNHLDSDTVRALCEALETFEGAIIAVSHDEAFVNRVIATAVTGDKASVNAGTALSGELWVMSKKKVQRFDGSFRDYKKAIRKVVLSGEDHKDV